mgnify:CR=1 FL=1
MSGENGSFVDRMGSLMFDIEHGLDIYSSNSCWLTSSLIYDDDYVDQLRSFSSHFHIYFIGRVPSLVVNDISEEGDCFVYFADFGGRKKEFRVNKPEGFSLKNIDGRYFMSSENGDVFDLPMPNSLPFEVLYVGQSYGDEGSRDVFDRLRRHETLQKISILEKKDNYEIVVCAVEIAAGNRVITVMNPFAKNSDDSDSRIENGFSKLYNTSEIERVSLYEASMIRYFRPEYNEKFKDSFPSTNHKVLRDCYEKDFSSVSASFSYDDVPFEMFSSVVGAGKQHLAQYNLHKDEDRKAFFMMGG